MIKIMFDKLFEHKCGSMLLFSNPYCGQIKSEKKLYLWGKSKQRARSRFRTFHFSPGSGVQSHLYSLLSPLLIHLSPIIYPTPPPIINITQCFHPQRPCTAWPTCLCSRHFQWNSERRCWRGGGWEGAREVRYFHIIELTDWKLTTKK